MKNYLLTFICVIALQSAFGQLQVRLTGPQAEYLASSATTNSDGSKSVNLFQENSKVNFSSGSNATGTIEASISWDNLLGSKSDNPSVQKNVYLMDMDFYIPQLERNRKVWVYLPPDYETSAKRYPVIYMQDGQNLFNEKTSFSGEWKVDETMNALFNAGDYGAIIVAVENGGWRRLDEYSPWYNDQLEAGGEGKEYGEFIVKTLKPYIDATYRSLPNREYTGLIGSSMGGLISHYVAMEYQDVFSKVGVLSPSFWFSKETYTHTTSKGKRGNLKYYTIAGQGEGTEMVSGLNKMVDMLGTMGHGSESIRKIIHPDGKHSETYWAREFGNAYKWLFADLNLENTPTEDVKTLNDLKVKIDENYNQLWISHLKNVEGAQIIIKSADGKYIKKFSIEGEGPIDISGVTAGNNTVNVVLQDRVIHTESINVLR